MRINNKKAQTGKGIMWIYRFILIVLILGVYSLIFVNFLYSKYDIRQAEAALLAKRVTDCIVNNGIVSDFDNKKIGECAGLSSIGKDEISQYYIIANLSNEKISTKGEFGNADLAELCSLKGNVPACLSQNYYVLSKNEGAKLNVLVAVSKIEERYKNI